VASSGSAFHNIKQDCEGQFIREYGFYRQVISDEDEKLAYLVDNPATVGKVALKVMALFL